MPVHTWTTKSGKRCAKWGKSGRTYCGKSAVKKAGKQGRAAYAHGYRG
jgi:hypothetical protein